MNPKRQFSDVHLDVLREIGNIGAGNAATSMAKLLNKKVDMKVPTVNVISFEEVMNMVGGPERLIVAIFIRIHGEAPGSVFFILSIEEAESLIRLITNNSTFSLLEEEDPSELAMSALKEVGNILTGSYLTALSDFTNINMHPSIPSLGIDMAGSILSAGLLEVSQVADYAIIIDSKFIEEESDDGIHGHFFLLPDHKSFPKLFNALGINGYE